MGWKKREISEKEVEQFSRHFQEQARFLVDESLGVEASRVISNLAGTPSMLVTSG